MNNALIYFGKKAYIADDKRLEERDMHTLIKEEVMLENEAEITRDKLYDKKERRSKVKEYMSIAVIAAIFGFGLAGIAFSNILPISTFGLNVVSTLSFVLSAGGIVSFVLKNKERKGLNSEIEYLEDNLDAIDEKRNSINSVKKEMSLSDSPELVTLREDNERLNVSLNRRLELLYKIGVYRRRYQRLYDAGVLEEELKDMYYPEEIAEASRVLIKDN